MTLRELISVISIDSTTEFIISIGDSNETQGVFSAYSLILAKYFLDKEVAWIRACGSNSYRVRIKEL